MKSGSSECACLTSGGSNGFSDNLLACAPCPPWTFQYDEFVTFAGQHNLSACEIRRIANKCGLEETPTFENITDVSVDNVTVSVLSRVSQGQDTLEPWLVAVIASSCAMVVLVALIGYIVVFSRHQSSNKSSDQSVKTNDQLGIGECSGIHFSQRKRGLSNASCTNSENMTQRNDAKSTMGPDIQEMGDTERDFREAKDDITDRIECSEMVR